MKKDKDTAKISGTTKKALEQALTSHAAANELVSAIEGMPDPGFPQKVLDDTQKMIEEVRQEVARTNEQHVASFRDAVKSVMDHVTNQVSTHQMAAESNAREAVKPFVEHTTTSIAALRSDLETSLKDIRDHLESTAAALKDHVESKAASTEESLRNAVRSFTDRFDSELDALKDQVSETNAAIDKGREDQKPPAPLDAAKTAEHPEHLEPNRATATVPDPPKSTPPTVKVAPKPDTTPETQAQAAAQKNAEPKTEPTPRGKLIEQARANEEASKARPAEENTAGHDK